MKIDNDYQQRILEIQQKYMHRGKGVKGIRVEGFDGEHVFFIGLDKRVYDIIKKVAPTHFPFLILGETGTGKELVARATHYMSNRREKKILTINCSTIPEHLLEAELFGYKKGAFTGAYTDKRGLFEEANEGTVFLDEIGDMPIELQPKLLRVLQDGELRMIGDTLNRKVDVRLICATNKDLYSMVKKNTFREDLYYRISVITTTLPPLRGRKQNITALAEYIFQVYLCELERECGQSRKVVFLPEVKKVLQKHSWPGNIRELENVVKRAVILSEHGVVTSMGIEFGQTPFRLMTSGYYGTTDLSVLTLKETIRPAEQERVLLALQRSQGNKTEAARELGIDRGTLCKLIGEYGLCEPIQLIKDSKEAAEKKRTLMALENNGWNITKAARELEVSHGAVRNKIRKYGITKK